MNNVPDIAQNKPNSFWHYAKLVNTYDRGHVRNKYKRCLYDIKFGRGKFRRRKIWKDPRTGETRETIEVEV